MADIPLRERCIVALDVPSRAEALRLVDSLAGVVNFYKIGLELFAAGEGRPLLDELTKRGCRVFVDLKLFDVPQTVARTTARLAGSGATFLTVHGNDAIIEAAVRERGDSLKILAVTALTSLDDADLRDLGFQCNTAELVLSRAKRASALGCDGVVSSGWEIAPIRAAGLDALTLVTPGVRLDKGGKDDQKRTGAPADMIAAGGDYLVVGRPIRDADNPASAAQAVIDDIQKGLDRRDSGLS